ncbi:MAG TPA: hypothetical protein VN921_00475 [Chthoniobacterales bacterium]|nr:hypothetical protein [Chthoniobacterales bacterium]
MDAAVAIRRGETETHVRLKRLALVWAQANGYSACAAEVSLPQCRYRADVAAYRARAKEAGQTAIFECKQALPDLRRDNCCSSATRERLRSVARRREILEKNLRVHYPTLRTGDSLFPEYDSHDFAAIGHRNYSRVLREFTALQTRLHGGRKFECLVRYRCANLFYLVVPNELFREEEAPLDWGILIESGDALALMRKPTWHDNAAENRFRFLQRIAIAGTRNCNRAFGISRDEIVATARLI